MHGPDAPHLFTGEMPDGAGHRMEIIILTMALAASNGMNFGGVVANGKNVTHGAAFKEVAAGFFGLGGVAELFSSGLFTYSPPPFDAIFTNAVDLVAKRPGFKSNANIILIKDPRPDQMKGRSVLQMTPKLQALLGGPLLSRPLHFAAGQLAVAVHLRRGDLRPPDPRVIPDEWYYRLVDQIRGFAPAADVHVWSSTEKSDTDPGRARWTPADFEGFRRRGCTVHLENEELVDAWSHFARAHILVAADSHFSLVGAVLNPHCVVGPGYIFNTLANIRERPANQTVEGAVNTDLEGTPSYDSVLWACVEAGLRAVRSPLR